MLSLENITLTHRIPFGQIKKALICMSDTQWSQAEVFQAMT